MIATAMAKADARVCVGSDRCYAFPHRLEDALASCAPSVRTGLVKLIPQANA
jgi:hypothetical protein